MDGDAADGTPTNVARFHQAVRARGADGVVQDKTYIAGVGTRWYDRLTGGGLGLGVSNNMAEGYRFLAERYEVGDAVFIVGFSRGAYTARALCGFIAKCGLLTPDNLSDDTIGNAYAYYKDHALDASTFRANYCHELRVRFLGVWDTVGALGVPLRALQGLNDWLFAFHDRTLSAIVDRAYRAVAVDEHRFDYQACLWDAKARPDQTIEQRWFVGDHCDGCAGATCHDTYTTFLGGEYANLNPRHARPIGATPAGNEAVDDTVYARRAQDPTYRPTNSGLRPL